MKFVVSKKRFATALKTIAPAVGIKSTLPVLTGVRITATDSGLVLEGTDLEASARVILHDDVKVEQPGGVVTPMKALGKAIASMTADEIAIESTETPARVVLRSGTRTVTLDCYPVEDFPTTVDQAAFEPIASVDATALAEVFGRASLCSSKDEARPVLTSVALFFKEGSSVLEVVATDSYRMGILSVPVTTKAGETRAMLVPSRVVKELAKQLRKSRSHVEIGSAAGGQIGFAFDSTFWSSRLIEGEYPNWQQIVPGETGAALEFEVDEMASALKAATAVGNGNGTPVRLNLAETTTLSLVEGDATAIRETLASAAFSPDGVGALEVAFNAVYLADALKFVGDERARMWIRDGLKPALIGPPDRRYVLMPVRLS
jgi:DNA polymerase-3 subunit beta